MYEYYHNGERPLTPPSGQHHLPPFGGPSVPSGFSSGSHSGPPSGSPPSFTPQQTTSQAPGIFAVDPGAIRPCTYRYVYIWLNTGESFWAWLVYVGRRSAAGWRWTRFRWIYFGVDLRNIDSFVCY